VEKMGRRPILEQVFPEHSAIDLGVMLNVHEKSLATRIKKNKDEQVEYKG
jgi:hypothetical protein